MHAPIYWSIDSKVGSSLENLKKFRRREVEDINKSLPEQAIRRQRLKHKHYSN